MKSKEALKLLGVSRVTLSTYVKMEKLKLQNYQMVITIMMINLFLIF